MIKILRKNNKKILAVIGVFLMIAFIVPTVAKNRFRQGAEHVVAYAGDDKITQHEVMQAGQQWDLLMRGLAIPDPYRGGEMALPVLMFQNRLSAAMPPEQAERWAHQMVREIDVVHYTLLMREADRMNVVVPQEQVEQLYKDLAKASPKVERFDADTVKYTLTNWLRVFGAFDRLAEAVKISPALAFHESAGREQQVSLKLVQFSAEPFKAKVPAPTAEQLQSFFEKYKNVDAGSGEFGFGYRFPNRVKFQSIKIDIDEVKETITGTPEGREAMVEYYYEHPEQFAAPATQPTTQPGTTRPATQPVAASAPTTRPWEALTAADKDSIALALARRRARGIMQAVTQRLSGDYASYKIALRDGDKTKAPSSLNAPYDSSLYLINLQEQVQKLKDSHRILPGRLEENVFRSAKELDAMPGIGKAVMRGMPFGFYATRYAEPLMAEAEIKQAHQYQVQTLALYQPSPVMEDERGSVYVFRVTGAEKTHAAPNLQAVEEQVRNDYTTYQAYLKAQEAARQFMEQAKKTSVAEAAKGVQGAEVITTGLFANSRSAKLEGVKLSDNAKPVFIEQAFGLLRERLKTSKDHPVGLVELPQALTVMVAQIDQAKPAEKDPSFDIQLAFRQQQLRAERAGSLLPGWFDPQAIEQRTKYRPAEAPARQQPAGPAAPPVVPGA